MNSRPTSDPVQPSSVPALSRRNAVAAAAWSLPALTLAGAAPAFAGSAPAAVALAVTSARAAVQPSDALVEFSTGWLPVGSPGHARHAWAGDPTAPGFTSGDDLTRPGTTGVVTVEYTYEVPANSTFTVSTDVSMGYGTPPAHGWFTRQEVQIDVVHASTTTLARIVPATPSDASAAQRDVRVSDADLAAAGFTFQPVVRGDGAASTRTYATSTLTTTTASTVLVRFTFTLPSVPKVEAEGGDDFYVHDDVAVTQPLVMVTT